MPCYLVHYLIHGRYYFKSNVLVELRHLRYFVAVAEEMNLTRAAARLHIAPPPLSVQIRNLEAEIGTALFLRHGRSLKLTEAGGVFLEQARKILADADQGISMARRAANGEIGHLSCGFIMAAEFRALPRVVPAFRAKWPQVHLDLHSFRTAQQLERLRRDELDLGFVWLPVPTDEFDVHELTHEPLVAVLPTGHRLASMPSLSIEDLSHEPLVLFSRTLLPKTFHRIEQSFDNAGAVMNVVYELETLLSVLNFVAMGTGCGLVVDYARHVRRDGIEYKPIMPSTVVKTLAIIKKRGRGGLADSFYRFTAENLSGECGELAASVPAPSEATAGHS